MDYVAVSLLNGISYGLLLFMLSAGLTLIFSMMGVLNFAHASFYMLGAYFAFELSGAFGFLVALILAPVFVGIAGALVQRFALRKVTAHEHVHELLFTFGLSYVILELVQAVWGKSSVPYQIPEALSGTLFTIQSVGFSTYRAFMMMISIFMLSAIYITLTRTRIGLIIQASLTHPHMAEALGHNVPRVFMIVFGGGCALAGLAGVIGGNAFVTEPGMAFSVGTIIFVVIVVGGMGSLMGALFASLLIGVVQTSAVSLHYSLANMLEVFGFVPTMDTFGYSVLKVTLSQAAGMLPYLLLVLILIFRPRGLMGTRET